MYIFKPYYKSVIWGGERICRLKGEPALSPCIGESWEISAMPGSESVVADGADKGLKLSALIGKYGRKVLGDAVYDKYDGRFPLLLKIIDAKKDLSVQVHPDQEMARRLHSCPGKTEMWYIVDHEPGAKLYNGLNCRLSPGEYCKMVKDKKIMEALQMHTVNSGDVYFVPSGRIHSIGAGNLLIEVQQASDITYRVYDFDRRDSNGNLRQLHTELAAQAIDFNVYPDHRVDYDAGAAEAVILDCDYFSVMRLQPRDGEIRFEMPAGACAMAICADGECVLSAGGDVRVLTKLHSALVPASAEVLKVGGNGVLLIAVPK